MKFFHILEAFSGDTLVTILLKYETITWFGLLLQKFIQWLFSWFKKESTGLVDKRFVFVAICPIVFFFFFKDTDKGKQMFNTILLGVSLKGDICSFCLNFLAIVYASKTEADLETELLQKLTMFVSLLKWIWSAYNTYFD